MEYTTTEDVLTVIKRPKTFKFKDIYQFVGIEDVEESLQKWGYKIVGFRPVGIGEFFVTAPFGAAVGNNVNNIISTKIPYLVVEKLPVLEPIPDQTEMLTAVLFRNAGIVFKSLEELNSFLKEKRLRLVGFGKAKSGEKLIMGMRVNVWPDLTYTIDGSYFIVEDWDKENI